MDDFHLLKDGSAIVSDQNFSFCVLNLNVVKLVRDAEVSGLTILSIPRGPKEVRTTSATAKQIY
jgi:hypothetical protein